MAIVPQAIGASTDSDAVLATGTSYALDSGDVAVSTAVGAIPAPSEIGPPILSSTHHLVLGPSVSKLEDSGTSSLAPTSEDSALHPLVLSTREDPTAEHDAEMESHSGDSSTDADDHAIVSADTEVALSAMLHPVHCYIPPEITDQIIASLDPSYEEERVTLCSCAVVCKNWLPASRRRLFQYIQLWESPTRYDLLVSRVLRSEHMRPWLTHVRKLFFFDKDPGDWNSKEQVMERGHRLVHDFSGRFPNLLHLELCDVDWSGCPRHRSAYLTFFSQLHSLQVLELIMCHFPSFFAFWRTVATLPSLRDLTLWWVDWPSARTASPIISPALAHWPELHTFNFDFDPSAQTRVHTLLSWLSQTSTPSSIRTLRCGGAWVFTQNPEFFQAVGGSVTEMTVQDYEGYELLSEDAFSSFSQLEYLNFWRVVGSGDWKNVAASLRNLPSRLRQLTIDVRLQETFTIKTDGNYGSDGEGLELLDSVLDRDNFASLEFVRFNIEGERSKALNEEVGNWMIIQGWEEKLPKLHARRIMKFCIYLWDSKAFETTNQDFTKNDHTNENQHKVEEEGEGEERRAA